MRSACEDLGGEQRGPGDLDFCFRAGPLAPVEGLDREPDDELIGRNLALSGSLLNAIPLLSGDPDVLLQ